MQKNSKAIVFLVDDSSAIDLLVCVSSLVRSNPDVNKNCDLVLVVYSQIKNVYLDIIHSIWGNFHIHKVSSFLIDNPIIKKIKYAGKREWCKASCEYKAHYRYSIFELESQYENILYLDNDLLIKGDISELLKVDTDKIKAAIKGDTVETLIATEELGLSRSLVREEFNAGVMSIGGSFLSRENVIEIIKLQRSIPPAKGNQSIFNLYFYNHWEKIEEKYNLATENINFEFDEKQSKFVPKNYEDSSIVHYVGSKKPSTLLNFIAERQGKEAEDILLMKQYNEEYISKFFEDNKKESISKYMFGSGQILHITSLKKSRIDIKNKTIEELHSPGYHTRREALIKVSKDYVEALGHLKKQICAAL